VPTVSRVAKVLPAFARRETRPKTLRERAQFRHDLGNATLPRVTQGPSREGRESGSEDDTSIHEIRIGDDSFMQAGDSLVD
jgi:hypothetical protein